MRPVPEQPSPVSVPAAADESIPRAFMHRALRAVEDLLVALVLAGIALLPLTGIVQREFGRFGVPGAAEWLTQLTFALAMLGVVLCAREKRLLNISALDFVLTGRIGSFARSLANALGAVVFGVVAFAAWEFVQGERSNAAVLSGGVREWTIALLLPLAFAALTLRLTWQAGQRALGRVLVLVLVATGLWWMHSWTGEPQGKWWPLAAALLVGTLLGMPLLAAIAGATALCLWNAGYPLASIPLKIQALTTNSTLPTIPLFTLAGYFLARGSSSQRLVAVFRALAGGLRSGPALVAVLVCAFFTTFTGASGVTILALGGLLMPMLRGSGYSERNALGLITGSSALGMLFPPCLPLILYAIVANTALANADVFSVERGGVTIEQMFLAGVLPGAVLLAFAWGWGILVSPKSIPASPKDAAQTPRLARAMWDAKWELVLPLVALALIFGGIATPLEAAAIAAAWAFLVVILRRDLKLTQLLGVLSECGALVGGILAILGASMALTHFLVLEEVPVRAAEWASQSLESKLAFLLALNGFLLVVGCLLDVFSAIVVVVPLIVPMGQEFGVDPIHLGIVFLANLELGYLTPPVGLNLFLSAGRFRKPFGEVVRSVLPLLAILALGVLVITYVPWLSTWLPSLLLK